MIFSPAGPAKTGALSAMFPQDCQLCGAATADLLCDGCRNELPLRFGPAVGAALDPACPVCGESSANDQVCGACLAEAPHFDATVTAFRYEFPLDRLLQAYKFRARLALTDLFADALAAGIERRWQAGVCVLPDLLVPLPLAPRRLAQRGFNQSVLLARAVGARLGLRVDAGVLKRIRDTPPQAGLKREQRRKNMRNAFACGGAASVLVGLPLAGLRIALVDDVMTTGATMSAAARALKKAGAARVEAWAVARALQHR